MICEIKLKTGFFKTKAYYLNIASKQLILSPKEALDKDEIDLTHQELISITVTKKARKITQLEIQTQERPYTGTFAPNTDTEEVFSILNREFDGIIKIESGGVNYV